MMKYMVRLSVWLFPTIIFIIHYLSYTLDYIWHFFEEDFSAIVFDFIIVGGGSAGCVIASRLSENPDFKVLLIEAGGSPTSLTKIPIIAPYLQKTPYDWQYTTVPQRNACLGLMEQRSFWPRGKGLGGCSQLNYMMYVRGHHRDYDHWADLGNKAWSFRDLLPYFKKSEDFKPQGSQWADYHGTDGYATVDSLKWAPLMKTFFDAGALLGYNVSSDCNGPQQGEFCRIHVNQRNSERCNTFECFLSTALHRPNLYIFSRAYAKKILIDKHKRAYGVLVERFGRLVELTSQKEVIVSSGSIGSPQLLMLSGIGPADHLESLKIPVIADLSVGKNLQDHYGTFLLPFLINQSISVNIERDLGHSELWSYFRSGTGLLTTVMGSQGTAFLKSSLSADNSWADVQLFLVLWSMSRDLEDSLGRLGGLRQDVVSSYIRPFQGSDAIEILTFVTRPKSRGQLWLTSSSPKDPPQIDPNYFSHEDDLKAVVDSIRVCVNIMQTEPFQRYGAKLPEIPILGCEGHELWSDKYWECYARHFTFTIYHPAGTCKMGPPEDSTAVVDSELRVYGVDGLRVADASIMPTLVNGNPHATVIMIAEKAADMIKARWRSTKTFAEEHSKVKKDREEL